jgi:PAS domain S-box-containing protein
LIETFIERLFTDDDQRARVETDRRRIRSGEGFEGAQYVILRKDGQSRCVDFHFSSFSGGYVIQMLDVTEAVRAERSLRESEHRFRMIVETFPGMVWITRNDGNYTPLYLSEHCREIFGYPAEDFLEGRQRFVDLVLEEDRSRVDEAVEQMIATRRFYDIELRFRRADGEIVWVHEIGGGVWDERDELVYLTGSMLDVTERKRAEQELRQREELLDAVFEASRDCIVVWSPEGQHLYVNAAAGHYLGSRPDRIVGRSIEEVLDRYGDVARLWRSRLKTVLRVQQQMRFEDENLLDGRTVCSESTLSPLRGANGQVFAVALVYRDVTSRRQMEQELRESERRYRSLFDRMPVGLYRTTPAGKVLDANPTLIEMLGHPDRDSLLEVGAARWSYVNPGDRDRWQRQIQAQGILRDFETRLRRYDGSVIWVRDTARSVHDPSGRLLYYEGFMEDITAWKQAQQETRRYQQRLQELALELSLAEERERRRLAGELHDGLGQMLVLSKIKLDLIRHADTPEDRENQIQNAMDLMDQSVAMSRSLTLQLSNPALYQFGFVAGAKWLTDDMKKLYGLRVRLDEDEHHKPLDERISVVLFRCLRELLINVAKHAEANEAEVKILRCEGCVRVIVSDCGKGFDAKRLAEFDRQGFGLFSISERIESLGGRMSIHSIPGEGTRVTLEVPLTEEASQTS